MARRSPHRPSLATVAEQVGVSKATVSNSFNRPEMVSAEVLARVLAEAERQNFSGPDPAARQLSRGRTDTLGLLFTDQLSYAFTDPAAVAFIRGLAMSCQSAGLNMLLVSTESTGDRTSAVGNAVVDGFVVYSVSADDPHLRRVLDRRLPTVVVDSPPNLQGVDWVGPDDRAGARELGSVLTTLGHRRIGVITGNGRAHYSGPAEGARIVSEPDSVHRSRILGLQDALAAVGVTDLPIEERPENSIEAGVDALHALLDRRPDLTAVCALMDLLALGALGAARERGLSVPDELTITGYDDIPAAVGAGLTTVSQPLIDKGRIAGELYLSHRPGSAPRRRILPTHVQVRSTSGPPRPGSETP
jgi:DNA-binding LacI/PurR family transcriptional regulator